MDKLVGRLHPPELASSKTEGRGIGGDTSRSRAPPCEMTLAPTVALRTVALDHTGYRVGWDFPSMRRSMHAVFEGTRSSA